jgi:hypothetical protein
MEGQPGRGERSASSMAIDGGNGERRNGCLELHNAGRIMVAIEAPLMPWMNRRVASGIGRLLLAWARGRRPRPVESGSAGRGRVAWPRGRPGLGSGHSTVHGA